MYTKNNNDGGQNNAATDYLGPFPLIDLSGCNTTDINVKSDSVTGI